VLFQQDVGSEERMRALLTAKKECFSDLIDTIHAAIIDVEKERYAPCAAAGCELDGRWAAAEEAAVLDKRSDK
jgi:hypothetical protein